MNVCLYEKYCQGSADMVYWHVNICVNSNFSEEKLYEFYCAKPNIANCLKIFTAYHFSMEVGIASGNEYIDFERDLIKAVPGIDHIDSTAIDCFLK